MIINLEFDSYYSKSINLTSEANLRTWLKDNLSALDTKIHSALSQLGIENISEIDQYISRQLKEISEYGHQLSLQNGDTNGHTIISYEEELDGSDDENYWPPIQDDEEEKYAQTIYLAAKQFKQKQFRSIQEKVVHDHIDYQLFRNIANDKLQLALKCQREYNDLLLIKTFLRMYKRVEFYHLLKSSKFVNDQINTIIDQNIPNQLDVKIFPKLRGFYHQVECISYFGNKFETMQLIWMLGYWPRRELITHCTINELSLIRLNQEEETIGKSISQLTVVEDYSMYMQRQFHNSFLRKPIPLNKEFLRFERKNSQKFPLMKIPAYAGLDTFEDKFQYHLQVRKLCKKVILTVQNMHSIGYGHLGIQHDSFIQNDHCKEGTELSLVPSTLELPLQEIVPVNYLSDQIQPYVAPESKVREQLTPIAFSKYQRDYRSNLLCSKFNPDFIDQKELFFKKRASNWNKFSKEEEIQLQQLIDEETKKWSIYEPINYSTMKPSTCENNDLYSLAVLLFKIICDRYPFGETNDIILKQNLINHKLYQMFLISINCHYDQNQQMRNFLRMPGFSQEFIYLVLRGLHPVPEMRTNLVEYLEHPFIYDIDI